MKWVIEGAGLPAMVVGSSVYYPRSFSQNLRKHLKLAFVDWKGFSQSTSSLEGVTLDTFVEDIETMRRQLKLEKFIIIGHSAHALLAIEYAKKYPQYISCVVMIGISPNLSASYAEAASVNFEESVWPERKEALQARVCALPDKELAKLSPAERFIKWYVRRDPEAWYDYTFNSSWLWEGVVLNMSMFDYLYRVVLSDLDITKGLSELKKPVFLALGRYDFIVAPPSAWDPIRSSFHDLTVRIFERSGHSPQYEEAPLFDEELLKFLSHKLK